MYELPDNTEIVNIGGLLYNLPIIVSTNDPRSMTTTCMALV